MRSLWRRLLGMSEFSESWHRTQERLDMRRGDESNVIRQWPIRKIVNEAAQFNTMRLRKRA